MKIVRWLAVLSLSYIVVSGAAADSVWQVSNGKSKLYLGGTVHMLNSSDYPFPPAYDKAYSASKVLVFETDVEKAQSDEFKIRMMKALTYQDGSRLKSAISPESFADLEAFAKTRNIPFERYGNFTPVGITLVFSVGEMQRLGMQQEYGVDAVYYQKAAKENKKIDHLESLDEQMNYILNMGGGDPDALIQYTLKDMDNMPKEIAAIKAAWRSGDLPALQKLTIDDMEKSYPEIYQSLVLQRNKNWIPKIEAMLKNKDVEFILVGAAHLAGPEGLVAQLQSEGYKVEKF